MLGGVMGKILWVDLSSGICREESVPEDVYRRLLSGIGLAAYYLYQRIPPHADPLGPDNVIAFVSGLLSGTGSLMTGRWMVAAKSPLTHTWGDANCGGTMAAAIKRSGYDGIFVTGASPTPVYLFIDSGRAELRDASRLWGLDTRETEIALQQKNVKRPMAVACIGPAGEKLSLISGIVNDQGRLAARSGLGAVMGSKKLKAVVLSGNLPIPVHDREEMKRLSQGFNRWASINPPFLPGKAFARVGTLLRKSPLAMRQDGLLYKIVLSRWGTIGMNQASIEMGDTPVQNWRGSDIDFPLKMSHRLDPDRITIHQQRRYHCRSCPVGCGGIVSVDGEEGTHKPEYESVMALGALLLNTDLDSIYRMNERLNRAGMDTISAGGTLAFAVECYERGLITREDTGGLELGWGNSASIERLLDLMIKREGIGDVLADGSLAAARKIGRGAEAFAVQAGGQELAMHDGRNDPGFTLHAVVDPAPGRHTTGAYLYYEMFQLWKKIPSLPAGSNRFYPKANKYNNPKEKAAMSAACSQLMMAANGAGLCLFGAFVGLNRLPLFEWLNACTGWQHAPEDYLRIGRDIQTLRQAFNAREGMPLRHAVNPRAAGQPPLQSGANKDRTVPLEQLVPAYWERMGWDPSSGKPLDGEEILAFVEQAS